MRIRQLVLVSEKRDPVVSDLCNLFRIEVAFYDPGIIHFGLENAVIPVGDTFLEVVSPVQENTTAGRFLERRRGNGGYMVIVQTDDLKERKKECNLKESTLFGMQTEKKREFMLKLFTYIQETLAEPYYPLTR